MANQKIYVFALAAQGEGISGSDRIFIEFARNWSKRNGVKIFVAEDGYQMCLRQNLKIPSIRFQISKASFYLSRIIEGLRVGLTIKLEDSVNTIIYSASEFWMDSLTAFILKLRYPKIKWLAAWYQTAPNPLKGFTEGTKVRYRLSALTYYLIQFPIKPLIKRYADFVLLNNENEKKVFLEHAKKGKAVIVDGAIDLEKITRWKMQNRNLPKIYDAVFQGRLHPQKGVLELIDIWNIVVSKRPDALLVIIGGGPLRGNIEEKIKDLKLQNNILLKGYLFDGEEKYKIFSQSKIVLHPSFYDSGGMSVLEAMAFGLPCVGFNLSSYRYYFPSGMLKMKIGDIEGFAVKALQLLSKKQIYLKAQREAEELISASCSWKYRSRQILIQVLE